MNGYPIISSDVPSRIEELRRRKEKLEFPHLATNYGLTTMTSCQITSAAAVNTWYTDTARPSPQMYSPNFVIPSISKMVVSADLFITMNQSGATSPYPDISLEYRYYQVRPQNGIVGDESNYTVLVSGGPYNDPFGFITSVLEYEVDFVNNFPQLIGTVGYFRSWVKTSATIIGTNDAFIQCVGAFYGPSNWRG